MRTCMLGQLALLVLAAALRGAEATPAVSAVTPADKVNLTGRWSDTGTGNVVTLTHDPDSGSVSATWAERADQSVFKVGDEALTATLAGKQLRGSIHLRFIPLDLWQNLYPDKWDHRGTLEMILADDGQTLSGQYTPWQINKKGETKERNPTPFSLQRIPGAVKDLTVGPLDGDL